MGGRDIGLETLDEIIQLTLDRDKPDPETMWLGAVLPQRAAASKPTVESAK